MNERSLAPPDARVTCDAVAHDDAQTHAGGLAETVLETRAG